MTERALNSFVDHCRSGQASVADMDDYVERWHAGPCAVDLHDYLGMTWDEYAAWVANPDLLPLIIKAHEGNRTLADVMNEAGCMPRATGTNRLPVHGPI